MSPWVDRGADDRQSSVGCHVTQAWCIGQGARRGACPMTATAAHRMSRVDTAWLPHGQRRQPDDDRRRSWLAPAVTIEAPARPGGQDKLLSTSVFGQCVTATRWGDLGDRRRRFRHPRPSCGAANRCPGVAAKASARPCRRRPTGRTARPRPAAVAVPPDRATGRGRQRGNRPHPPLHRRRHRADLGDDVDHRWRSSPRAARASAARRSDEGD